MWRNFAKSGHTVCSYIVQFTMNDDEVEKNSKPVKKMISVEPIRRIRCTPCKNKSLVKTQLLWNCSGGQCDQMSKLLFNVWSFKTLKICQNHINVPK